MGLVRLGRDSTAENVFDALRQLVPNVVLKTDGYPDGLEVSAPEVHEYSDAGLNWEKEVETMAWVVKWDYWSFSRGRTVRYGMVLINVDEGGLAPDGWADTRRYAAPLVDDHEELEALMLVAERDCWPKAKAFEEM